MSALTEALCAAQAELPTAIPRDSQGYGYRYTSLDKLIELTRPILTKHGITITQAPTYAAVGDELRPVLVTLLSVDDDDMTIETPLYVTDKTMQGFGAAITYARRYAWAAVLGIASEEDTDAATSPKDAEDVPF
jgi:ERF superfamily protein